MAALESTINASAAEDGPVAKPGADETALTTTEDADETALATAEDAVDGDGGAAGDGPASSSEPEAQEARWPEAVAIVGPDSERLRLARPPAPYDETVRGAGALELKLESTLPATLQIFWGAAPAAVAPLVRLSGDASPARGGGGGRGGGGAGDGHAAGN